MNMNPFQIIATPLLKPRRGIAASVAPVVSAPGRQNARSGLLFAAVRGIFRAPEVFMHKKGLEVIHV